MIEMKREFKSFYTVTSVFGIRESGLHELIFREKGSAREVYGILEREETSAENVNIMNLFAEGEELCSSELIRRIKEEFGCGDKAAYAKLKKWKTGEYRKGRSVFYRKEHFVDSASNGEVEASESRDYQQRVVKEFMEELDIGEDEGEGEGEDDEGDDGGGEYDGELPGREELEEMFGLR